MGSIEQTFDGRALYPSVEEKAANLLCFIIKDHPFVDGNKRFSRNKDLPDSLTTHLLNKPPEFQRKLRSERDFRTKSATLRNNVLYA